MGLLLHCNSEQYILPGDGVDDDNLFGSFPTINTTAISTADVVHYDLAAICCNTMLRSSHVRDSYMVIIEHIVISSPTYTHLNLFPIVIGII